LIALNTPAPNGLKGIPVLLWGKPGVGKTSFIESLASEKWKVLTIIASIHDPTDFSGLPVYDEGGVKYIAPTWVDSLAEVDDSILFIDELSTCPPSVQASLLRVIFERKVGFKKLPDNVRIVAAANPPDLMVGGWELSPPMRNRFIHINWDIPTEVYLSALNDGWSEGHIINIDPDKHNKLLPSWKDKVAAFLRISPDLLHGEPAKETFGYASPRTWDYIIHLMASCELKEIKPSLELMEGCLGEGTAISFAEFLSNLKQPNPLYVLSGEKKIELSNFNDGEIYILFSGMERILLNDPDKEEFLTYAGNFLDLSQQASLAGKRDVIFVSLQHLAKEGFLTKVISNAQVNAPEQYNKLMAKITDLFTEEGLVEFIDVLS